MPKSSSSVGHVNRRAAIGPSSIVRHFARESLSIVGWFAMWRPMQIFLSHWWPLRHLEKIDEELSRIPVGLHIMRSATTAS